ncbi:hypothetical protein N7537_011627 [Penicillium hordei]|jgi:hypothetical protein|uniref:Secreted protein n=1 Tax=Penicillium hordei TaxID=40994 RepID=A0AAD6DM52_9EURO|nr:uncharacterized protein N7537_011627 [Penicillium hordei]KAJ5588949.1 hypothetical protein N7537_011627 [Penicillium hordei]
MAWPTTAPIMIVWPLAAAGLRSRLENKPEIYKFTPRSALDRIRLRGHHLRHPNKLTTDAMANSQAW